MPNDVNVYLFFFFESYKRYFKITGRSYEVTFVNQLKMLQNIKYLKRNMFSIV